MANYTAADVKALRERSGAGMMDCKNALDEANGDGENLLPALRGEFILRTRPIFWRTTYGNKNDPNFWPDLAVRDGNWKLVTTFDGQRVELHNLKTNRSEDISKDQSKDHPEIVARLTKQTLDWNATLPTKADPSCLGSEPKKLSEKATKSEVPVRDRNGPFNRWDTNKDGSLTLEEYTTDPKNSAASEGRFKRFDKNNDGKVSREEFVGPSAK
jgi:hypothetical protein